MAVIKSDRTILRKNSTGSEFLARRVNLIEGSNVTITMTADTTDNETDITIASTGGGGTALSGIQNKLAFFGTASSLSGASAAHWDSTNGRLGLWEGTPNERLTLGVGSRFSMGFATGLSNASGYGKVYFSPVDSLLHLITPAGLDYPWATGNGTVAGAGVAAKMAYWVNASTVSHATTVNFLGSNGFLGINKTTPTSNLHVVGNYVLDNADTATRSYRFRTTGSDLDFDFAGANMVFSGYPNADYTGTQKIYAIMGGTFDFVTWYGNHEWKDRTGSAIQHVINPEGSVVFNEQGSASRDFRVEGDTLTNLLMVDASADSVGFGTTTPSDKAIVEMSSTTKGFLPPRMTTTERGNITSPPTGLMIYNTTTNKLNFYNGSTWEAVTSA